MNLDFDDKGTPIFVTEQISAHILHRLVATRLKIRDRARITALAVSQWGTKKPSAEGRNFVNLKSNAMKKEKRPYSRMVYLIMLKSFVADVSCIRI